LAFGLKYCIIVLVTGSAMIIEGDFSHIIDKAVAAPWNSYNLKIHI
jgi:hypothetical protein